MLQAAEKKSCLLSSRLYCWFWNFTKSCAVRRFLRAALADFTANREFHPAPKTLLFSCLTNYTILRSLPQKKSPVLFICTSSRISLTPVYFSSGQIIDDGPHRIPPCFPVILAEKAMLSRKQFPGKCRAGDVVAPA